MGRENLFQPPIAEPYRKPGEVPREQRLVRTQEVPKPPATSFAEARARSQERKAAVMAEAVATEKAKILAELAIHDYQTKISLLKGKERDLMFEKAAFDDADKAAAVDRNYVGDGPGKFKDDDAWKFSLEARRGGIEAVRADLEKII
ncbi:MAG: hypothetical protein V1716_03560 [Candidatus Uhrbacteria bacterium]